MKKLVIVAACVAFVMFLGLGLVAACVVSTGRSIHLGFVQGETASRQETKSLEISSGKLLDVAVRHGAIRVTASSGGSPSLTAKLTASGSTQEKANALLAEAKIDVQDTGDGLRLRVLGEESREKSLLGALSTGGLTADLDLVVPIGVRLDVRSESGDVEAEGSFGSAKVHSSYGSVKIRDVDGDLEATSSSGDVTVRGTKGKRVLAKSSYGAVHLAECGSAEVEVHSSSGDVSLKDWNGTRATVSTNYGGVAVEHTSGTVEAKSSSGAVKVREHEGALTAHSSYGGVRVEGVFAALEADSSSGDVVARAKSGSRIDGEWRLKSSYGGVKLVIPDGLGCHLDAKTSYGAVSVGVPIEMDAGTTKKSSHSVRGNVNGGGGSVELRCTSGDVNVEVGGR